MITFTKNPDGLLSEYYRYESVIKKIASEFDELISNPSAISNPQRCDELLNNYDDFLLMCNDALDELNDLTEAMEPDDPRRKIFRIIVKNKRDAMPEKELKMDEMEDSLSKTITKQADKKPRRQIKKKETFKTNEKIKTALYFGSIFATTLAYLISK